MRLLHTSDWHLGRLLYAHDLIEDQAHLLDQLVACIADRKPDAVIIAGDIYDRALPPPHAVKLLDDVLCRIVIELRTPVIIIAGNHDSADRLGFGARLMSSSGLHVAGQIHATPDPIILGDASGELRVYALPYAEPAAIRDVFTTPVHEHEAAMRLRLDAIRAVHPASARSVVVAHAFVSGGSESDSERPLSVGGSGAVGADIFAGFDYVALGHLHRPQTLHGRIRYAGSLLKYSLSEVSHKKSISLIEISANAAPVVEEIFLSSRRDLRLVEGTLAEIILAGRADPRSDDYVHARVLDTGALLDPMRSLRNVYPNAVSIDRPALSQTGESATAGSRLARRSTAELFDDFFREVTGEATGPEREAELTRVLQRLLDEDREAR